MSNENSPPEWEPDIEFLDSIRHYNKVMRECLVHAHLEMLDDEHRRKYKRPFDRRWASDAPKDKTFKKWIRK